MKPENDSGRVDRRANSGRAATAGQGSRRLTAPDGFALAFGLFLGLAIVKFGNPVILEAKIDPPATFAEYCAYAWPPSWSLWLLVPLSLAGAFLAVILKPQWPGARWLWILPAAWFSWQLVSATNTADRSLTLATLWQFGGCLAAYFLGALVLGRERGLPWLLAGLLAGFTFCLMQAVKQKIEFPREKAALLESERMGWTNLPPELFLEYKRSGVVITTNGMEVANPIFIAKYTKGRVHGTLVYPNALAGVVLLLLPGSLVLSFVNTRRFRTMTRIAVIALSLFLGGAGLFWTGSKSGWLIAVAVGGVWLFRLQWANWAKWTTLALVLAAGLTVFGLRFRNYFAAGATSVGARFDYWRAAAQIARDHPFVGSGPGTFQHPYARIKSPEAEMAKLVHNDYLEQFSDSGFVAGLSYVAWIGLLLTTLGRRVWRVDNPLYFGLFTGLLGWFAQGLSEFGLYVPALAWTAFALSGCLLKLTGESVRQGVSRPVTSSRE